MERLRRCSDETYTDVIECELLMMFRWRSQVERR